MKRKAVAEVTHFSCFESPVGWLGILAGPTGLVEVVSGPTAQAVRERVRERYPAARERAGEDVVAAIGQLREYFSGTRQTFDLPLDLARLPPFTRRVLDCLRQVPAGTTVTYGALAAMAGNPRAARAVGAAMAGNPLPIVIPCHRVIGAGGALVGYSGGKGLETKAWLLEFERSAGGRRS